MRLIAVLLAPLRWLLSHDAGLFEVLSGFATMGWGLLSMQTFPPGEQPASSNVFTEHGMQCEAAIVAIVIGLGQMFAFGLIDRDWDRHWLRFGAACACMWLWSNLFVSSLTGGLPVPPTVLALATFAVGNTLLLSRILQSKRHGRR